MFENASAKEVNARCLTCHAGGHAGARSFEESPVHTAMIGDLKSNKLSSTTSGCHDTFHNVGQLDHAKYWKPAE
jgi:hypothetical protein